MNKIPYIILFICFISMTILAYKNNEVIKLQNEEIYIYQQKNIDNIIGKIMRCNLKGEKYLFIVDSVYQSEKGLMIKSLSYPDILLSECEHYTIGYLTK